MRTMLRFCPLLALFLGLALVTEVKVEASYTLRTNLYEFVNTVHRKANGFCCDNNSTCSNDCNNQFRFCVDSITEPPGSCSLGEYVSSFINSDQITFSDQNAVQNPVIFRVQNKWPGAVNVLVQVEDKLTTIKEQMPLVFEVLVMVNISHNPIVSSTDKVTYASGQGQFLKMNFELECSEGYHGFDCGVFCLSRNDSFGHFSCDRNGNIVCLKGFNNTETNCTECILSDQCSATGGYCNSTDPCICREEYAGEHCDIDLDMCGHNTFLCLNNGVCLNSGPDNFTCSCTAGYEGRTCTMETNECIQNICQNGGVCKDKYLDYECECSPGFEGRNCEVELDGCLGQICLNNGTCLNMLGNFTCQCSSGFLGRLCEIVIDTTSSSLSAGMWSIIGGAVAAAALLIVILCLFIVLVCTLRQRHQRKLAVSTFKKDDSAEPSQQVFSAENPTYEQSDSNAPVINQSRSNGCFDDPTYAELGQPNPTNSNYSRLESRMGQIANPLHSVLAPTSGSVLDLLNYIGDYSTLNDSMQSLSTTESKAKDHQYEQIQFGTRGETNHVRAENGSKQDCFILYQNTSSSKPTPAASKRQYVGIELSAMEQPGLLNPYENFVTSPNSPTSVSPDSAAATPYPSTNRDCLELKNSEAERSGGLSRVGGKERSDLHDYDMVEGVLREKENLAASCANGLSSTPPLTETEPDYDEVPL